MPDLDLRPSEYRVKGLKRLRRNLPEKWWGRLAIVTGVWCGFLLAFADNILLTLPWLAPAWLLAAAALPGFLIWLYVAFFTEPQR